MECLRQTVEPYISSYVHIYFTYSRVHMCSDKGFFYYTILLQIPHHLCIKTLCMAFFCITSDFVRDMCLILPNPGFMSVKVEKKPVGNFYS